MTMLPDFGRIIRGFGSHDNTMVVQPRLSYTFFATFHINPSAPVGNLKTAGIATHKLFSSIKSIGKPGLEYDVDRMRAYNAPYLMKKKVTYKDIPLTFHDDSTSFVQGLAKAYRAFYSFAGNKTTDTSEIDRATGYGAGTSQSTALADNGFTIIDGSPVENPVYQGNSDIVVTGSRAPTYGGRTGKLASVGLRTRTERNFFEKIKIYDLGSEPNSINIYTIFNPIFSNIDQVAMDYTTTTLQEVTCNVAYEDFTEQIGVDLNEALRSENFLSPALVSNIKNEYYKRTGNFNGRSSAASNSSAVSVGIGDGSERPLPRVETIPYLTYLAQQQAAGTPAAAPIPEDATICSWRNALLDTTLAPIRQTDRAASADIESLVSHYPNPTADV